MEGTGEGAYDGSGCALDDSGTGTKMPCEVEGVGSGLRTSEMTLLAASTGEEAGGSAGIADADSTGDGRALSAGTKVSLATECRSATYS